MDPSLNFVCGKREAVQLCVESDEADGQSQSDVE